MATQAFCFHLNFIYGCNPNLVKKIKKPVFDARPTDEEIRDILQFSQIDCDKIHLIRLDDVENSHQKTAKKCENQTYIKEQLNQFYDIFRISCHFVKHIDWTSIKWQHRLSAFT